ncbi:MAG: potassium-transporting ATPase subunit KdpC [Hafnia alvei]|uniref:potassium-transporting ATPase subunit KdpC n=1 Tax=Hafnia alvei TaxID=569 RepID=UPI00290899B4|nr:potassium-transporting ATPase subunit KdpC [Hafnia alvei]MDU7481226.1 potassium-transporting ATPase subunit KdpC [Hafnia alvei]
MSLLRPSIMMMLILTAITGIAYPLLTTGLAQVMFHSQAEGSLIERDGVIVGSRLIGQNFTQPKYFWDRPSATADAAYNPQASGGSNLAASNTQLDKNLKARAALLRQADPSAPVAIPVDLMTSSASGLDPHISPQAAYYQAARIAKVRNLPLASVEKLIAANTKYSLPQFISQPVVNVLELNMALDALLPHNASNTHS